MRASLGPHLENAARPVPDTNDPAGMKAGSAKRFCFAPPKAVEGIYEELEAFVKQWLIENLVPLKPDSDTSVETWINNTAYTQARKDELLRKWKANPDMSLDRNRCVKMFLKDENYPEYKYPRGINSRVDEFKVATGPIFKLIEKELFSLDWFIKKIPVSERPAYIRKRLGHGLKFLATDYSSFEACFVKKLMMACEFVLYEYMTRHLPGGDDWLVLIREVIAGTNTLHNKYFKTFVEATRMSGEMNTSLGNSFSNLMFMLFLAKKIGSHSVTGVVEGDDGLFAMCGRFPTAEEFTQLGLVIKIDEHDDVSTASFCGLIFDTEDMINVTDPIKVLETFGWTTRQYARSNSKRLRELLKCKALSLIYQYNGSPIITALACYALRMTKNVRAKPGQCGVWEREELRNALSFRGAIRAVPDRTRILVEAKFGISIEHQKTLESYFDAKEVLGPINHDLIVMYSGSDSQHYYHNYVRVVDVKSKLSDEPTFGSNASALNDIVVNVMEEGKKVHTLR